MYKVQNYNVGDTIFEVCGPNLGRNFNCWNIIPSPIPYLRILNDSTASIEVFQGVAKLISSDTSGQNLVNIDYSVPDSGWVSLGVFSNGQTDLVCPYYNAQNHIKFVLKTTGNGLLFVRTDYK